MKVLKSIGLSIVTVAVSALWLMVTFTIIRWAWLTAGQLLGLIGLM